MKLRSLLRSLPDLEIPLEIRGSKDIEISGLSIDSRSTSPGHLFIAKKGMVHDGSTFIEKALEAGAIATLCDLYDPFLTKTQLIHPDPSSLIAPLASRFYRKPSRELLVFGVTGTKGKTTTTYLAKQLLDAINLPSGLIGTVETMAGDFCCPSTLTTHDPIFNQKWLREMVTRGCKAACLEVSSHGLMQHRVEEIDFDAALFTNLYSDHLDYHKTMDDYAGAKKKLFELLEKSPKQRKRALFNRDSPWSAWMQEGVAGKVPSWTFGIDQPADIRATDYVFSAEGAEFLVHFQGQKVLFQIPLIGKFNVYNALGAIGLALHTGASLEQLEAAALHLRGAPGRLERAAPQVFVDFAHTGESLAHALSTLKEMTQKKLWVVFGCGGDRDPNRRIQMAKAAERYADRIVVTSDNPRSESPEEICRQILSGFQERERVYVELDRKAAITYAVSLLQEGDLLLVAGKGHEKVQIFARHTVPFDDVAVVQQSS